MKKEGTLSLSFAQSLPFTVSETTELDARAGAVGTSAERWVLPSCFTNFLHSLFLQLPLLQRRSEGRAALGELWQQITERD